LNKSGRKKSKASDRNHKPNVYSGISIGYTDQIDEASLGEEHVAQSAHPGRLEERGRKGRMRGPPYFGVGWFQISVLSMGEAAAVVGGE